MELALTLEEMEFFHANAMKRVEANKKNRDIADYNPKCFNLTGLQANAVGLLAEGAAFKALGGNVLQHTLDEWAHYVPNDHPEYKRLVKENADLFNAVEVRRCNRLGNPIPIRAKDRKPGRVIVQVYVPYTQQERFGPIRVQRKAVITGWARESDWENGEVPRWAASTSTRVVTPRPWDTFPMDEVLGGTQ